jgi:hypothetical protein
MIVFVATNLPFCRAATCTSYLSSVIYHKLFLTAELYYVAASNNHVPVTRNMHCSHKCETLNSAVGVNINHVVAQREYSTWYDHLSHLSGNKHPSFVSNMPNLLVC